MCAYNSAVPTTPPSSSTSDIEHIPSDIESPTTTQNLRTLQISLKMDDQAYMHSRTAHMPENIPGDSGLPEGRRSSATPSTSAYDTHDIPTTYSSVAHFNAYSAPPYDSSLPTPTSVAGSPSLSERSASKMMHSSYSQQGGNSQQPTPPGTSRPWSYPVHVTTAASTAPMALHSTADIMEMHGLETSTHSSPEGQEPMGNPTPQFHWGQYSVSTDAHDELSPPMAHHPLFPSQLPSVAPSALINSTSNMPLAPAPSHVPMLQSSPDPHDMTHAMHAMDGLPTSYTSFAQQHPTVLFDIAPAYSSRRSSKAKAARANRNSKKQRASSRADGQQGSSSSNGLQGKSNRSNAKTLTLKQDAPECDKYLLELRCQMDEDRGKGMWDHIATLYKERFGLKERAGLQMQLTRAVMKHGEWPAEEDEALRQAAEEWERRRLTEIKKLMKDFGGYQAWEWREGHIAKRLVSLGIDEFDEDEPNKRPRRQRKNAVRKHSSASQWPMHHLYDQPPELRPVTAEQEAFLLDEFCKPGPLSPEPDMMQGVTEDGCLSRMSADRDPGEDQSARVAKQACDAMLAKSSIYPPMGHHHNG
ncbi:hypothetical protein F5Y15DRAFT_124413 [Xylariaceae sp. FL0016]|nr:hypothetical protein F5Y15DRAFT_124413 [Xylariaceae sp. FL0016]